MSRSLQLSWMERDEMKWNLPFSRLTLRSVGGRSPHTKHIFRGGSQLYSKVSQVEPTWNFMNVFNRVITCLIHSHFSDLKCVFFSTHCGGPRLTRMRIRLGSRSVYRWEMWEALFWDLMTALVGIGWWIECARCSHCRVWENKTRLWVSEGFHHRLEKEISSFRVSSTSSSYTGVYEDEDGLLEQLKSCNGLQGRLIDVKIPKNIWNKN